MKRLLFALCLLPSIAFGAAIDFRNLNTNHFTTNGFRVGLKSIPTNQTIAQFTTNTFNSLVGTGTVTTTIVTNIVENGPFIRRTNGFGTNTYINGLRVSNWFNMNATFDTNAVGSAAIAVDDGTVVEDTLDFGIAVYNFVAGGGGHQLVDTLHGVIVGGVQNTNHLSQDSSIFGASTSLMTNVLDCTIIGSQRSEMRDSYLGYFYGGGRHIASGKSNFFSLGGSNTVPANDTGLIGWNMSTGDPFNIHIGFADATKVTFSNGVTTMRGRALVEERLGIGTSAPLSPLHVVGGVAISNAQVSVGRVLTVTNANGQATWQDATGSGGGLTNAVDSAGGLSAIATVSSSNTLILHPPINNNLPGGVPFTGTPTNDFETTSRFYYDNAAHKLWLTGPFDASVSVRLDDNSVASQLSHFAVGTTTSTDFLLASGGNLRWRVSANGGLISYETGVASNAVVLKIFGTSGAVHQTNLFEWASNGGTNILGYITSNGVVVAPGIISVGDLTVLGTANLGQVSAQQDSGVSTAFDMNVTAGASAGSEQSLSLKMDGATYVKWGGNQTGGVVTNPAVTLPAGSGLIVGPSGATLTNFLSALAALDFPDTAAGTHSDLPITVTGVTTNHFVSVSAPFQGMMPNSSYGAFTSNDTVWVRFVNGSLVSSQNPAAAVYRYEAHGFR